MPWGQSQTEGQLSFAPSCKVWVEKLENPAALLLRMCSKVSPLSLCSDVGVGGPLATTEFIWHPEANDWWMENCILHYHANFEMNGMKIQPPYYYACADFTTYERAYRRLDPNRAIWSPEANHRLKGNWVLLFHAKFGLKSLKNQLPYYYGCVARFRHCRYVLM